jgi:hypothetical protein
MQGFDINWAKDVVASIAKEKVNWVEIGKMKFSNLEKNGGESSCKTKGVRCNNSYV